MIEFLIGNLPFAPNVSLAANSPTCSSLFIEAKANLEAVDHTNQSALMYASSRNHESSAFLLLNALSSERVNHLLNEPDLNPMIQSFMHTILMAKSKTATVFIGMFSKKIKANSFLGLPIELRDKVLDYIFPTWLRNRAEIQVDAMQELTRFFNNLSLLPPEPPQAVIFSARAGRPSLLAADETSPNAAASPARFDF